MFWTAVTASQKLLIKLIEFHCFNSAWFKVRKEHRRHAIRAAAIMAQSLTEFDVCTKLCYNIQHDGITDVTVDINIVEREKRQL